MPSNPKTPRKKAKKWLLEDNSGGGVLAWDRPMEPQKPQCDLSTQCPLCGSKMEPEHAHYRCRCGYRDSCCM